MIKGVLFRTTSTELGGADRLYPQVTIDALPDSLLLDTFDFYLDKDYADEIDYCHNYDRWQTLVHVCRRWRCVVFASPRRLDLKLYCTRQRLANEKMLDIWPAFPIVIVALSIQSKEEVINTIAALRQHNRVCKIDYYHQQFQDSFLEEFAAIDEPFPALTDLQLSSFQQGNVPVLPDSFLGGSAPRLRSLNLVGIPFPSVGKLLASTTNLVRLSLCRIPHSGYITHKSIVSCLSILPRLKAFSLGFQYPQSHAHRGLGRPPPPLTRSVIPNLNFLYFYGNIEYLEDILSHIETPLLTQSEFHFFNQLVFDTPLLGHFFRHTEALMTIHRAHVEFSTCAVVATFLGQEEMANNDREDLRLEVACKPLDWQISALSQVLNSFVSSLENLKSLEIAVRPVPHKDWQSEIEVIQWLELMYPFMLVKDITLEFEDSVRLIAPALQELSGERHTQILPALQNLFLRTYHWQPSGHVKNAIEQFIATRQFDGRPVTVHY